MSRRWPLTGFLWAALAAVLTSGCVDRRFVIESDPPNANVAINGRPVGATPVDRQFTYYGTYHFVFDHDGYERLTVDEDIKMPWYEIFPLEFVAENILPFTIRDIHYIRKPLPPIRVVAPEETLQKGSVLQAQGRALEPHVSIGTPQPLAQPAPPCLAPPTAAPAPPGPAVLQPPG